MGQVKRGFDNTTQGTLNVRTEGRTTSISKGTLPARPVPPPVLVARWTIDPSEVAASFDGITEVGYRERRTFGKGRGR